MMPVYQKVHMYVIYQASLSDEMEWFILLEKEHLFVGCDGME